jgi:hypothetical protein
VVLGASGSWRTIRLVDDLLIALAGGAIGAVLAGIGVAVIRLSAVPGDVARHDRRAQALDEDLERWVADDHRRVREELEAIAYDHNARGIFHSGIHLRARAEAKTRALQRYRDRLSQSERALEDLEAEESWPHGLWRFVTRRPQLALRAPERVEPVIEDWRGQVAVAGMGDRAPVHDPTQWATEDLIRDVRERPLDR